MRRVSTTRVFLSCSLVYTFFLAGNVAAAQQTEHRLQLGVTTSLVQHTRSTAESDRLGMEVNTSHTEWGTGSAVTLEVAYGFGPMVAFGAFAAVNGASDEVDPGDGTDMESSQFAVSFGPKLDVMFAPNSRVRPLLGVNGGLLVGTAEDPSGLDSSILGFGVAGQIGLRIFPIEGVSLDPAFAIGWRTLSVETSNGTAEVEIDASAFAVGLTFGISAWFP